MATSLIDFSAQFGGLDAADLVLPYFKALKKACQNIEVDDFPFQNLTFILRVDGEIRSFNFSGLERIKRSRSKEYISVDLGIMQKDYGRVSEVISESILSSIKLFSNFFEKKKLNHNPEALKYCILELISKYKNLCNGVGNSV